MAQWVRNKFGAPCSKLRSLLKKVLVTLLGHFGAAIIIRPPGNCAPLPPALRPDQRRVVGWFRLTQHRNIDDNKPSSHSTSTHLQTTPLSRPLLSGSFALDTLHQAVLLLNERKFVYDVTVCPFHENPVCSELSLHCHAWLVIHDWRYHGRWNYRDCHGRSIPDVWDGNHALESLSWRRYLAFVTLSRFAQFLDSSLASAWIASRMTAFFSWKYVRACHQQMTTEKKLCHKFLKDLSKMQKNWSYKITLIEFSM